MSHTAVLERLATHMGIAVERLHAAETASVLSVEATVSAKSAKSLARLDVESFVDAFGEAGSMWIRDGDLPELTIESGVFDARELERLRGSTASSNLLVAIRIDKTNLVDRLIPDVGGAQVVLFLFAEAADRLLSEGPKAVQEQLWSDQTRRLVLVALSSDELIRGSAISVVGGQALHAAADECKRPIPDELERISIWRNAFVGWDSRIETRFTPNHFRHESPSSGGLARRLDTLAVGMAAMFICDRARPVDGADCEEFVQTEFRGREHVAFVPVRWTDTLTGATRSDVTAALDVVEWCYQPISGRADDHSIADRLPFVQTRVAQLTENQPAEARLDAFVRIMPVVLEGVEWHWRAFVEGRVNEYLEHVRDLESVVDSTVERLSDNTSSLVKRLSETALAAIAVLIGSFIGAAFKTPFNADLFRVGMLSYAAYVVVFPLVIGVSSIRGDVKVALRAFTAKRANLARVLGDDRVATLVSERDSKATNRFSIWMWIVVGAYVVASAAAVVAATEVPDIVDNVPISTPGSP